MSHNSERALVHWSLKHYYVKLSVNPMLAPTIEQSTGTVEYENLSKANASPGGIRCDIQATAII